ncbi:molybdate ABC transporter substrate-binding protein [Domibacillus sp. A3M-37]|uniref:molybdate ABC transporter substrate-binding protein n=1 Tax=Domibacillus TaxID=1433999 RepID=UPI0020B7ECCC|nr:molybdate ABC transporter substrate-binding protein [Domibacillus sp. A3M-37]MCP3763508.1 molybdate ABC transporter substrate-binding protein [Domibacillus sp. A3M-37]
MKKRWAGMLIMMLAVGSGVQAFKGETDESILIVGAAASFNPVLDQLEAAFEAQYPQVDVRFHTGGSGMIARQVEAYAPIDVIMLASKKEADSLEEKGLIQMERADGFLTNRLVVIEPDRSKAHWPAVQKVVMGTPGAVPVGTYAEQVLESMKWDGIRIYAKDASSVLMWVSSGEADAGIVYKTDAMSSNDVRITHVFSSAVHDPIVYNAGIVTESLHPEADVFEAFLSSTEAMRIFETYGFQSGGEEK